MDDDEFFNQNFLYDQNYHRNPTVMQNEEEEEGKAKAPKGLFLDFSISRDHSSNGSFEAKSRLSRIVKSDLISDADCFEGYLEKKSPKLLRGWQVSIKQTQDIYNNETKIFDY